VKKKRTSLGPDLRKFDRIGGNPTKVYQGERPGPPDKKVLAKIAKRAEKAAAKISAEMRMYLEAFAEKKDHADAYLLLHPNCPTRESARRRGWETMRKIRQHLSENEIYDLLGLSREAITTAIADALGATSQKDFILPRSGKIISTPPVASHEVRLAAAALGVKVRKMAVDEESKQTLVVNLIDYSGGLGPWPNGGRTGVPIGNRIPTPSLPQTTITVDPASVSTGNRHD
jgi:hypothetical protein